MKTEKIISKNEMVLKDYFIGMISGHYYDGSSYQLYLDTDNFEIFEHHEASNNSWLQRDDNSLHCICKTSGYSDLPEDELYSDDELYTEGYQLSEDELYTEGCQLSDFGWGEWLDNVIEFEIEKIMKDQNENSKQKLK